MPKYDKITSLTLKRKAERAYNVYLKQIEHLMGHNQTTMSSELENTGRSLLGQRFRGVYPSDRIPKLNNHEMIIANLDKHGQPGSHWIALIEHNGKLHMYDSFGRDYKKIIPNLPQTGNGKVIMTEDDAEQDLNGSELNCGQRCLAVLLLYKKKGIKYVKWI